MFSITKSGKIALCLAAGAMTTAVAAGPAVADAPDGHGHHHLYKGRVIARTGLLVRTGPSTHYRVVGFNKYGSIVKIVCKKNGENIRGNKRWYRLADGRYAWSSARYIENIGPAPRWC
ncbi:SH3 domain-containing protein [Streptomyces sp. NPDC059740]|uniref:SH3 domain-containing protein n=1 Tax=Streptomyces sp. NPDC059740 TaxID=3346926 RepID=UPI00365B1F81